MAVLDYLKDRRVLALIAIVALLGILDYHYGIHLGIEFAGGTQIPITLEHQVTAAQMDQLISILQQRLSTFGLKEINVQGIGSSQVTVQIPSVSQKDIQDVVSIIQSQGVFQGVVNGKVAIDGSSIVSGSVGAGQPTVSNGNVSWSVSFYVTQQGAEQFAKVAFGQANKPLYMFLDRPTSAIVLLNSSVLGSAGTSQQQALQALASAMQVGNRTIPVELLSSDAGNWNSLYSFFKANAGKYQDVILVNGTSQRIIDNLTALNYTVVTESIANMTPTLTTGSGISQGSSFIVQSWPAVGLLSAPLLNPGVTNGSISQSYVINGAAPTTLPLAQKETYATQQATLIQSVLNGGALPVHVIVGVPTVTPPTLGSSFERISVIALVLAIIAVSIVIAVRYRKAFLIAPIILTTLAELFIIMSIIGLIGTIDLSAIAGMIAVIGTGVDAQIIISDEVLGMHRDSTMKLRLGSAFYIVWADAFLLTVAMLPLFFSTSLVTVIGFSESTIIGALLGAFITRPSYGAIIGRHYAGKQNA
jgi:preprotein translocase subunit SecD